MTKAEFRGRRVQIMWRRSRRRSVWQCWTPFRKSLSAVLFAAFLVFPASMGIAAAQSAASGEKTSAAPPQPDSAGKTDDQKRTAGAEEQQTGASGDDKEDKQDNKGKQDDGGKQGKESKKDDEEKLSPEQKMNRRFPQPVKVSFLIGLSMLDENNSVLGRITSVEKTPDGKLKLIIGYGGVLGIGQRPVAVPVEVVGMLGHDVAAVDMPKEKFKEAATWNASEGRPLGPGETIRVAVIRRSL